MTAQQLKNSILQMAVQGKLVSQDPNDEPASILLERARAEKKQMIRDEEIKKEKNPSVIFRGEDNLPYEIIGDSEPACIADEVPFEIPDSWEWVRLGSICDVARGGSPRPIKQYLTDSPDGVNWIKIGDTDKGGKYIYSTKEKIKPEGVSKSRMVYSGDLLLTNSMSFGRPYILKIDGCIHDGWLVLNGFKKCFDPDFLYYELSSSFAYYQFCGVVSGAVVKNLNSEKVENLLFPVPPMQEQRKIVKKLDDLLPCIDDYNVKYKALDNYNSEFPDKLKKSILQQAVQGKLVPQDPADEPASVLLERIRAEKEQMVKCRKIKQDRNPSIIFRGENNLPYEKVGDNEPVCIADEVPFEIPDSWEWVRFKELIRIISGTSYDKKDVASEGIRILRGGNIVNEMLVYSPDDVFLPTTYYDSEKTIHKGDVIFVASTGSKTVIGKPAQILSNDKETQIGAFLRIARPIYIEVKDFIWLIFQTDYYRGHIRELAVGTNINNVKSEYVEELLIPVPPLPEQKRIMERIEMLLSIIENI